MRIVADDAGEALFERYLNERGYEIVKRHPDLGNGKKPDYLIRGAGHEVVTEVKTFETPRRPGPSPSCFVKVDLKPVRRKISAAAEQLKGIAKLPLVVVLANPHNWWLPLAPHQITEAMYGDMFFTFADDGDGHWCHGRNGRLHVDEPDGEVRGNHPHVSAVAVLRCSSAPDARLAALLRACNGVRPIAELPEMIGMSERDGVDGEAVSLDVFEVVSETACPLPPKVFDGPHDTRWGEVRSGHYGPLGPKLAQEGLSIPEIQLGLNDPTELRDLA